MTTTVSVVYFSGFKGTTKRLAQAICRGAQTLEDVDVAMIGVREIDHHWKRLHMSDAIIFGSPTYVGSVAAEFKVFIEKLAGEIWLKRLWLNKVCGGFTVSAGRSGDKLNCLQDLAAAAAQMGMIWVPVRITGGNYSSQGSEADLNRMAGYLGVMAQANIDEPIEISPPPSDIQTCEMHGAHIASVAKQLKTGRAAYMPEHEALVHKELETVTGDLPKGLADL